MNSVYRGIYILVTKDGYRIFAGDITNIYTGIDPETGDWVIDNVSVKACFGKSEVLSSEECALKAAIEVSKITGEVEDGIFWVRDLATVAFEEFVAGVK